MNKEYEIVNGVIDSFQLTVERGFILSANLFINHTGGTQGFGGFALYLGKSSSNHRVESFAGHYIYRCLGVADVYNIEKLQGKAIRIAKEKGHNGLIKGIGHIYKDDWFFPEDDFKL